MRAVKIMIIATEYYGAGGGGTNCRLLSVLDPYNLPTILKIEFENNFVHGGKGMHHLGTHLDPLLCRGTFCAQS